MIDKARIEAEAEHFFEWPTKDRSAVTLNSAVIFANTIAEMVRAEAMRGEFICGKCSLRRDAAQPANHDF